MIEKYFFLKKRYCLLFIFIFSVSNFIGISYSNNISILNKSKNTKDLLINYKFLEKKDLINNFSSSWWNIFFLNEIGEFSKMTKNLLTNLKKMNLEVEMNQKRFKKQIKEISHKIMIYKNLSFNSSKKIFRPDNFKKKWSLEALEKAYYAFVELQTSGEDDNRRFAKIKKTYKKYGQRYINKYLKYSQENNLDNKKIFLLEMIVYKLEEIISFRKIEFLKEQIKNRNVVLKLTKSRIKNNFILMTPSTKNY